MHCYMFRTEQQRPSWCDLARGWRTEVAGRTRTIPAPRRPDCYLGIGASYSQLTRCERAAHWRFERAIRRGRRPRALYIWQRTGAATIIFVEVIEVSRPHCRSSNHRFLVLLSGPVIPLSFARRTNVWQIVLEHRERTEPSYGSYIWSSEPDPTSIAQRISVIPVRNGRNSKGTVQEARREQGPIGPSPDGTGRAQYRRGLTPTRKAIFCSWLRSTKQNAFDCGWSREVFLQELLRVLVLCWNGKRNFHLSAICLHPTGDGHSKVEAMLKALKEDVEESERLREKRNLMKKSMEIQKKQSLWLRFKNEMQHYYHGFKLLYIDVKVCLRLLRRLLTGETLMRKERRQLIRTTSDLFRLVPFLIFIIVPFMEFALPLVLKFFPGLLPSTFQEEHKEQEKRNKALKVKLDMAKFLQDTLEDLSLERKKNSDGLNQLTEFSAFMKKIREEGGGYVSNDDLLKYSKFFEDELTLDSLSYAQLRALCLIVGIQPIGTTNMLLLQLRLKLRELKADDQLIVKEGIDSLSESELQTACRARGMRALGVPVSRLKAQLAKWLELSLNEQVPPSLLLLSSTLYIQEDVPFSVRLKTILSTLPSHIADEAKIKLAEIEGVRVDNKTKFDLIVSLEEALKKEAEEQRSKQKEKGVAQKATVVRSPTEEVEAVVKAASVPVTESDVLLDSAPLVKDKSTQIDAPIESSELREIEHLVETVKGPLNEVKDDLIELKEQVQEHKEEVEEVQSIFKSRGDDVKVSKAARLLQSQVDRLVERVDKLVDRMEGKKIIATVDEKQIDSSAIAKHEKKMATLSEVLAPLKQLKQMPNEAKMKRIYQVLEAFDEDRDGAIDLDLALKVIDLMMKESVEINSEQVNKALEILKKEEDLLGESAASDSAEKKSKNGKGLHQSKLAQ
ncbi:LETM1 and EF-hand domain-containing protein 1, mitochondrial [Trichinella nativa]|uniref:LETM1 and EF-hand domain-containing protein 1, mitochondrial n=1 Tax=Trichinella nativa TaxID=6335 RepID=A0A0V1KUB3_9BILA|nr:LETM1 and EF-hand domain-containing protein 1, mitochondrial [Trichinella nativa]